MLATKLTQLEELEKQRRSITDEIEKLLKDVEAVSSEEAASMLGVSPARIREMILKSRALKGYTVHRHIMIPRVYVEERLQWIQKHGRKPVKGERV